ncbi:MAG TPA: hypothetical protein DHW42_06715 [Candidatus Marinimicrobia bacterium]|nr:hypothetical protein [Candidatus Neomarinimicrobiota bacterium]
MNNLISLKYFVPELLLIFTALGLFISNDAQRLRSKRLRIVILFSGLVISLLLNIYSLYNPPHGLFYNMFAADSFGIFFKITILISAILIFTIELLDPQTNRNFDLKIMPKIIIVIGSILLVSVNDAIQLFLCSGLISFTGIALLQTYNVGEPDSQVSRSFITNNLLAFAVLFFGFSLLFGISGSLNFQSIGLKLTDLNQSPLILALLFIFILFGFGFHIGIIPFQFSVPGIVCGFPSNLNIYNIFIPGIAYFGVLVRFLHWTINPLEGIITAKVPPNILIALFGLITIIIGNILLFRKQSLKELLAYSALIHSGLILLGLSVSSSLSISASVFLLISVIIIYLGIFSARKLLKNHEPVQLLFITIFLLGLVGLPATAGFSARFLLFQALLQSALPNWITSLAIINLMPIVFFILRKILNIYNDTQSSSLSAPPLNLIILPLTFLSGLIYLGLFWEPIYKIINQSLIFFEF